jgi:hypothetical protein
VATDGDIAGIRAKLELKLHGLSTRMQDEHVDLGDAATDAIVEALTQIPGALDAAAAVVSGAMYQGLGATFDKSSDAVDTGGGGNGWEYTAVMDGATCDECAAHDGEQYDTWEEIAGAAGPLPDGGPNPDCYGDGRCRCRASIA